MEGGKKPKWKFWLKLLFGDIAAVTLELRGP
jgi:hypothetical protein